MEKLGSHTECQHSGWWLHPPLHNNALSYKFSYSIWSHNTWSALFLAWDRLPKSNVLTTYNYPRLFEIPSGSSSLGIPSWTSAMANASSRFSRLDRPRTLSMSTSSGRIAWMTEWKATPLLQLRPKSFTSKPGCLYVEKNTKSCHMLTLRKLCLMLHAKPTAFYQQRRASYIKSVFKQENKTQCSKITNLVLVFPIQILDFSVFDGYQCSWITVNTLKYTNLNVCDYGPKVAIKYPIISVQTVIPIISSIKCHFFHPFFNDCEDYVLVAELLVDFIGSKPLEI